MHFGACASARTAACLILVFAARVGAVGVKARQARAEAAKPWPTKSDFLQRLRTSGDEAVLLDVGANDGAWGAHVAQLVRQLRPNARMRLIMFEPQPFFARQLRALAARHNGTYVPAAAWHTAANLSFAECRCLAHTLAP